MSVTRPSGRVLGRSGQMQGPISPVSATHGFVLRSRGPVFISSSRHAETRNVASPHTISVRCCPPTYVLVNKLCVAAEAGVSQHIKLRSPRVCRFPAQMKEKKSSDDAHAPTPAESANCLNAMSFMRGWLGQDEKNRPAIAKSVEAERKLKRDLHLGEV